MKLKNCCSVAAVALIATFAAAQASAQSGSNLAAYSSVKQSEWADNFDSSGSALENIVSSAPILNPVTFQAMEAAIQDHERLVSQGGWEKVPDHATLKIGVTDSAVENLRRRLVASGDLRLSMREGAIFDSYVAEAVRRFQSRHGLPPDAIVGPSTLGALNVSAADRLRQLRFSLGRMRALGTNLGDRYILVNIPAAHMEAVENGVVRSQHTVVAGMPGRQTPLLSSKIHEVNFNPFWTVPVSIIRKDLIPKMQEDPEYLTRSRIRIFSHDGREIPPANVNWNSDEAVNYLFKQDPGDQNSLGSLRLNFHNVHQVYLHDTPMRGLFGSDKRFESSGCVRVQNVRELVSWILRDDGFNRNKVDGTIRSGERLNVRVSRPPALHLSYFTAWTRGDGVIHFRDDIYNLLTTDGAVASNG